ncbi:hypothetical protein AC1031_001944 [Aphanomyces cochlioides]|nr:hypothetical protein AC1031_001944 [Aphanomyces cochlioides]
MSFLQRLRAALLKNPAQLIASPKRASVAAIFRHSPVAGEEDKIQLLFIRRKVNPRDAWSGQMAFPGGRAKEGEEDLMAAIRETWEEIGIEINESDMIGRLDDRPVHYGKTVATPFVFYVKNDVPFTPKLQADEVSDVLWVDVDFITTSPIKNLRIPSKYIFPDVRALHAAEQANGAPLEMEHIDFPCIYLPRPNGQPEDDKERHVHDFVLWGLTYNMVSDILHAGGFEKLPMLSEAVRSLQEKIFHNKIGKPESNL